MAVPQRIVSHDETALFYDRHRHFVDLDVAPLVAVDEGHVERDTQPRRLLDGVADGKRDAVGPRRPVDPRPREVLQLVVHLERPNMSALRQPLGQAQGAVAAERAHLEHPLRAYHPDQHAQQPSLLVPAGHAAVEQSQVRGPPQPVQIVRLRIDMLFDIIVQPQNISYLLSLIFYLLPPSAPPAPAGSCRGRSRR